MRHVEILKDGYYQIAVRVEGSALVNIDDHSFSAEATDLDYAYLSAVHLEEGRHDLEISYVEGVSTYLDVVWLYSVAGKSETLEEIFITNNKPTEVFSYHKVNATKYRVRVSAQQPFVLSFAETHSPPWVAKVNG